MLYIYIAIEIVTKILELRTYWPCDTQIQPVFLHRSIARCETVTQQHSCYSLPFVVFADARIFIYMIYFHMTRLAFVGDHGFNSWDL